MQVQRLSSRYLQFILAIVTVTLVTLTITLSGGFFGTRAPALAQAVPLHPMDALTASEYSLTKQLLQQAGYIDSDSRFPLITLREPPKAEVLSWTPGQPFSRAAFAIVKQGPDVYEAIVDLSAQQVTSWRPMPGVQPSLLLEEIIGVTELTIGHPDWQAAMQKRGITDFSQVFCAPLAVGYYGLPEEEGRRILRVPCFDTRGTKNNLFGKPIEGVTAVVDLNERKVLEVIDTGVVPISPASHAYDEASVGTLRPPLKPVLLAQPQGNNITVKDSLIRWQKWAFHLRFDRRLGTVVSLVNYEDNGQLRPVLYQGTLSEIFVPYMDGSLGWYYRTYMDVGEYGFGLLATSLTPGIDCPTTAILIDATLPDDEGNSYLAKNVACVFERYQGDPVWRHSEVFNKTYEGRPQVDLVVRMISTIGNYDYALDWVFSQTGAIKGMIGATGMDGVKGVKAQSMADAASAADTAYGTLVAPGLAAINHDHFFNFRLDLDVDGRTNRFVKEDLKAQTLPADNPRRSIWLTDAKVIPTDSQAKFKLNYETPSRWRVLSSQQQNAVGNPTSYQIMPIDNQANLLLPEDYPSRRAGFVNYHLWVTPYHPDEHYAAGAYPNQSKGGDGLPAWTSHNRSIADTDIVTWYTLGFHHMPIAEDWPIMPTTWHGFMLKPVNFFDRNPALDLRNP